MAFLRSFDRAEILERAPLGAAIASLRACFAGRPTHIERSSHPVAGAELLVMPAVDGDSAGVKLLVLQPANAGRGRPVIQGTYVLFDAEQGEPVALFDAAALTDVRTPAVSAIATDALARVDVETLGIIGSGPQALAHIEAMFCVRPGLARVVVASRNPANAQRLVERVLARRPGSRRRETVVGSYADAAGCDVVCLATRSAQALVDASMVTHGAHINAVGSYRCDMREIAGDLIARATVFVDDVDAAQHEAGDLVLAAAEGWWSWDRVAGDLAALCCAGPARSDDSDITLFKSVGLAVEDLVVARLVAGG